MSILTDDLEIVGYFWKWDGITTMPLTFIDLDEHARMMSGTMVQDFILDATFVPVYADPRAMDRARSA